MTSPVTTTTQTHSNLRIYPDLSVGGTVTMDTLLGQSGLEMSTIDPASHQSIMSSHIAPPPSSLIGQSQPSSILVSQSQATSSHITPPTSSQLVLPGSAHLPGITPTSAHLTLSTGPQPILEAHHPHPNIATPSQSTAVITQLIHPNSFISGISNTMNVPSHITHTHTQYHM